MLSKKSAGEGICHHKRRAADTNTFLLHPEAHNGQGLTLHIDGGAHLFDKGDILGQKFIIKGIAAEGISDQDDLVRIIIMLLRRAGEGNVGFTQLTFILGS